MSETTTLRSNLELTESQRVALHEAALRALPTSPVKRLDRRRKRVQRGADADLMKRLKVEWIAAELAAAAETLRNYQSRQCWPADMRAVWPDVVRSTFESYNTDLARAGLAEQTRVTPSAAEISRMDRVIGWLTWLNGRERKVVWSIASGLSLRKVAAMFGKGKDSIHEDHVSALLIVALRLYEVSRQQGKPTIAKIK
jgi:hypothetical protein